MFWRFLALIISFMNQVSKSNWQIQWLGGVGIRDCWSYPFICSFYLMLCMSLLGSVWYYAPLCTSKSNLFVVWSGVHGTMRRLFVHLQTSHSHNSIYMSWGSLNCLVLQSCVEKRTALCFCIWGSFDCPEIIGYDGVFCMISRLEISL